MRSTITFVIEHGEDIDDLESFADNIGEDNRFSYPGLEFVDYSVKVDI